MISTKRGRAGLLAVAASTLALGGVVGTAGISSAEPAAASGQSAPAGRSASAPRPAQAGTGSTAPGKYKDYTAKTWHRANVRACASTKCRKETEVKAKHTYYIKCWKYGQKVSDLGHTNNVWLAVRYTDGDFGYASAIYFKGNKYANLPKKARC